MANDSNGDKNGNIADNVSQMINKSVKGIFPNKDIQLVRGFVNRIQKEQTSSNENMIHTNRYTSRN